METTLDPPQSTDSHATESFTSPKYYCDDADTTATYNVLVECMTAAQTEVVTV